MSFEFQDYIYLERPQCLYFIFSSMFKSSVLFVVLSSL